MTRNFYYALNSSDPHEDTWRTLVKNSDTECHNACEKESERIVAASEGVLSNSKIL